TVLGAKAVFRKWRISALINPHPITPIEGGGSWTRHFAASSALAAVRFALMIEPSRMASGTPVSAEFNTRTAEARSRPLSELAGKEAIHLIPATGRPPPRYAGRAMIRFRGCSGK